MTRKTTNQLRRVPKQARSRDQVNKLLNAAAEVFALVGYDAATTNAIAERANTSIGSLYQFFPNKAAIFHALTVRYLAQFREVLDRVVTLEVAQLPLHELIDRIIDAFWECSQSQRGHAQMLLSARLSAELAAEENALIAESVQRIEAILSVRAPTLDDTRRTLVATVAVDVVNTLLGRAATSPPAFGDQVIAEAKTLLYAFLRPYMSDDAMPPARTDHT